MSVIDVHLIEIGTPKWPRWMIFHASNHEYWSKGQWRERRCDGELWHDKHEAVEEMQLVKMSWPTDEMDNE